MANPSPQGRAAAKRTRPPASKAAAKKNPARRHMAARRSPSRMRRIATAPVTVAFFPLILVAIAALYISWSAAVQFTYLSMGFAAGLVVMATGWMFIRFLLPGSVNVITKDPRAYATVIAAILVSLSICMLAG